jgi:hypothetical protein
MDLLLLIWTDKWQTYPLVRESAPHTHNSNCQSETNIWSWVPKGSGHQARLADWLTDWLADWPTDWLTASHTLPYLYFMPKSLYTNNSTNHEILVFLSVVGHFCVTTDFLSEIRHIFRIFWREVSSFRSNLISLRVCPPQISCCCKRNFVHLLGSMRPLLWSIGQSS